MPRKPRVELLINRYEASAQAGEPFGFLVRWPDGRTTRYTLHQWRSVLCNNILKRRRRWVVQVAASHGVESARRDYRCDATKQNAQESPLASCDSQGR